MERSTLSAGRGGPSDSRSPPPVVLSESGLVLPPPLVLRPILHTTRRDQYSGRSGSPGLDWSLQGPSGRSPADGAAIGHLASGGRHGSHDRCQGSAFTRRTTPSSFALATKIATSSNIRTTMRPALNENRLRASTIIYARRTSRSDKSLSFPSTAESSICPIRDTIES